MQLVKERQGKWSLKVIMTDNRSPHSLFLLSTALLACSTFMNSYIWLCVRNHQGWMRNIIAIQQLDIFPLKDGTNNLPHIHHRVGFKAFL